MATDSSASSTTQSQVSSYEDDLITMARIIKHQHTAVACLLTDNLDKLDPVTGDASCQVRAIIILVFHRSLKTWLAESFDTAVILSRHYLKAHTCDKLDTKARTTDDIRGADHFKDFDVLVNNVRAFLGDDDFELLGLTYSLCISGVAGTDEFEIDFRHRCNNLWGDYDRVLKTRLAQLSCVKFINLTRALPSGWKLVEALKRTRSIIERDGLDDMPVLSIQATFLAALAILYFWDIPIVNSIVRVEIDQNEGTGNYIYKLGSTRALFYLANKETGKFEREENPSPEQKSRPAFYIKSWSTYNTFSADTGLYSADHTSYYNTLSEISIDWAVIVYTACHPPFTRRARDADMDIFSVYKAIDGVAANTELKYSRYNLEGFEIQHFTEIPRQERPLTHNLSTLQKLATDIATEYGLDGECQLVRMGAPSSQCTFRITRPVDWQIAHASAATTNWVNDKLQALEHRHKMASNAVIGRYVFSLGKSGASHEDQAKATELHNTKTESTRRKKYLAQYANNEPLLRR